LDKKDLKEFIIQTKDESKLNIVIDLMRQKFGKNIEKNYNIRDLKKYISNTRDYFNNQCDQTKQIVSENSQIVDVDLEDLKQGQNLLKEKGFDPEEYIIKNAWVKNKSLSLNIQQKEKPISKQDLQEIVKNTGTIKLPSPKKGGKQNYLINFADIHFGITKLEDIRDTLVNIKNYFLTQDADQIHINLLGDEFNSAITGKSLTEQGTQLNKTYGRMAKVEAFEFFKTLFTELSSLCKEIHVHRAHGNHDGGTSWDFLYFLSILYPNIKFYLSFDDFKQEYRDYYLVDSIGVMIVHGDLGKGRFLEAFQKEAWEVYSNSKTRIIISGHLHSEKVTEIQGVKIYQIGTNKSLDNWSNKNMFLPSFTKRNWSIFKLDKYEVQGIEYI
jgi:UDP-2,3-diacylglucosamine pyrophosphatase LpxH/CxxC motif-containing protein